MMKIIIFIFVNVYFAFCIKIPESLRCIDEHCKETISTARLIKAVSPPYGTLKKIKESSKVYIKGKNNDKENTLWLVEHEGLHGFVDVSFIKEIKNSVRNELLNVKNPYYNEIVDSISSKGDSSDLPLNMKPENIKTTLSEKNEYIDDNEKINANFTNKETTENVNNSKNKNDHLVNSKQMDTKLENTDQINVKQENVVINEVPEHTDILPNIEKNSTTEAANEITAKINENSDTNETAKQLMDSDPKNENSMTKETLNVKIDKSNNEKIIEESSNKKTESLKDIPKDEHVNSKFIENPTVHKNTQESLRNEKDVVNEKNESLKSNHKPNMIENAVNTDTRQSQGENVEYETKDNTIPLETEKQNAVVQNSDLKASVINESQQNDSNQLEEETTSGKEKEKPPPMIHNPESRTPVNRDAEISSVKLKETEKNSSEIKLQPKIDPPKINIESINEKENHLPSEMKEQIGIERPNREIKDYDKQSSETKNQVDKEESRTVIDSSKKPIESQKIDNPTNLEIERKNSQQLGSATKNPVGIEEKENKETRNLNTGIIDEDQMVSKETLSSVNINNNVDNSKNPVDTEKKENKESHKLNTRIIDTENEVPNETLPSHKIDNNVDNSKNQVNIEKKENKKSRNLNTRIIDTENEVPNETLPSHKIDNNIDKSKNPVDIEKKKSRESRNLNTRIIDTENEVPNETPPRIKVNNVDNSRTDNENRSTVSRSSSSEATHSKSDGPVRVRDKIIDNHDRLASGVRKDLENDVNDDLRDQRASGNSDPWLDSSREGEVPGSIKSPLIWLALKLDSLSQRAILHVLSRLGVDASCTLGRFSQSWLQMSLESLLSVLGTLVVLGLITYSPTVFRFHRNWQAEFARQARVVSELQEQLDTVEETRQKLSVQNHQFERVIDGYKREIVEIQQEAASNKKTVLAEFEKIKKSSEQHIRTLKLDLVTRTQQFQALELDVSRGRDTIDALEQEAAARRREFDEELTSRDALVTQLEGAMNEMGRRIEELERQALERSRDMEAVQVALEHSRKEFDEKCEDYGTLEKSFETLRVFEGLEIEERTARREVFLELTACKEQLERTEQICDHLRVELAGSTDRVRALETAYETAEQRRLEHDADRLDAVAKQEAAETKLKVLSDYFKDKEVEMARNLGLRGIESSQSQDQVDVLNHRIGLLETETEEATKIIKRLNVEIREAQSFANKCKHDANEQSHEFMFRINNLERNLQAERDTSKQLRAKLSHYIGPIPPRGAVPNHNKDRPSSRQSTNSGGAGGGSSSTSGISNFVSLPPQLIPISLLPQSSSAAMQHSPFSGRNSVTSKKSNNA